MPLRRFLFLIKRRNFVFVLAAVVLFVFIRLFAWTTSPNSTCPKIRSDRDDLLVPNVVHFIHFDAPLLPFVSFVCILAAFYHQDPEKIVFHSNLEPSAFTEQDRWKRLEAVIGHRLELRRAKKPTHVFGQPIGNVYHANDLFKVRLALEEGGIFLDQDTYVVRSLDDLRNSEVTIGWPEGEFVGIQCILAKPGATFIDLWQQSYRDYRPTMWNYNSADLPTNRVLKPCPDLVSRVPELLGVRNLAQELYGEENWSGWRDYYAIHLLFRHRTYLVAADVEASGGIKDFDEDNILTYNRTFGHMARVVLARMKEDLLRV